MKKKKYLNYFKTQHIYTQDTGTKAFNISVVNTINLCSFVCVKKKKK